MLDSDFLQITSTDVVSVWPQTHKSTYVKLDQTRVVLNVSLCFSLLRLCVARFALSSSSTQTRARTRTPSSKPALRDKNTTNYIHTRLNWKRARSNLFQVIAFIPILPYVNTLNRV